MYIRIKKNFFKSKLLHLFLPLKYPHFHDGLLLPNRNIWNRLNSVARQEGTTQVNLGPPESAGLGSLASKPRSRWNTVGTIQSIQEKNKQTCPIHKIHRHVMWNLLDSLSESMQPSIFSVLLHLFHIQDNKLDGYPPPLLLIHRAPSCMVLSSWYSPLQSCSVKEPTQVKMWKCRMWNGIKPPPHRQPSWYWGTLVVAPAAQLS